MSTSAQLAFYFDQSRCMACNSCTVACKDWNQLNPGLVNWREQYTYEQNGGFFPLSMGCNHCEDPACLKACPAAAISKGDDGIVTVDRSSCKQYESCVTACPFAKPKIGEDKQEPHPETGWQVRHPMQKCTMCADRLANDDSPACVKACVGRALDFGSIDYITSRYTDAVRMNPNDFPYAYKNNKTDTKPAFFVKKRGALTIHKSTVYDGK